MAMPEDTRTPAEIDADIAQLRNELISTINPQIAYRIRGIAHLAGATPAGAFNLLLTELQPILDVTMAAMDFTDRPNPTTVRELTDAVEALRKRSRTDAGDPLTKQLRNKLQF